MLLHTGGEGDEDSDDTKKSVIVATTSTTTAATTDTAAVTSPYIKKTVPAELALCLDTMGQGRKFTKDDIAVSTLFCFKV
jgi:hypothetical protein